MQRFVALVTCVVFVLSSEACTSLRVVPAEDIDSKTKIIERIRPGDVVYITDDQVESFQIKVDFNDGQKIRGDGKEFDVAHVTKIEVRQFDAYKTTGLVLLAAAYIFLIYVLVSFLQPGGSSNPP